MIALLAAGWWMAIGAGGLIVVLCVAVVVAACVQLYRDNPAKRGFDVQEMDFGSFDFKPQDKTKEQDK